MSTFKVRNLDFLRSADPSTPGYGGRLYEALQDLISAHTNHVSQTNGNLVGEPAQPPSVNGLNVTAQNGHFNIAIADNNNIYRGIRYYVEHADNPNFTNAVHTQASGSESRNHNEYLGNVTRYFRAYSAYQSSSPSQTVVHGGASPIAVSGGGAAGGPSFLPSQGSGTGAVGVSHQGPGKIPFRSPNGSPPVR